MSRLTTLSYHIDFGPINLSFINNENDRLMGLKLGFATNITG